MGLNELNEKLRNSLLLLLILFFTAGLTIIANKYIKKVRKKNQTLIPHLQYETNSLLEHL
jgi:hypothetical protein